MGRIAALAAAVVFVAAVGVGLYLAGSPGEQRLVRFDQQRVLHLTEIRKSIDEYWRTHRALPARVDEDVIGITMPRVPRDPETDAEYEYELRGDDAYRLCAVFSRASADHMADEFWAHDAGRHCFDFQVTEHDGDQAAVPSWRPVHARRCGNRRQLPASTAPISPRPLAGLALPS